MKLIIGLGNPGRIYEHTRHNIGRSVVKRLSEKYGIPLKKNRGLSCLIGEGVIEGKGVVLALPVTYMNNSGPAIKGLLEKYKSSFKDFILVHDDVDLEFGRLKFKLSGSSAGHRGVESVIKSLGSRSFQRLRVGVGRPQEQYEDTAEFVLSPFLKKERKVLPSVIEKAATACGMWITHTADLCMSVYNKRSEDE